MKSLLPAASYWDEQLFTRERRLFEASWQLVAFTSDVRGPNDYVVVNVNDRSVVIQNFDGELRAFHNVCAHRQSRIHAEGRGSGPLRCPYHGWTYGCDGLAMGIPNRSMFDPEDLSSPAEITLEAYHLEVCGSFIFIRRSSEGPSLRAFLCEAYENVHAVGAAIGEQLSCYRMQFRANWKVVVENTLEAYHVNQVHHHSLRKLGIAGTSFGFQGPHSSFRSTIAEKQSAARDRLMQAFRSRSFRTDDYMHQLVFPNVTIASAQGTSFNVNLIRPLGPAHTEIDVYVFEPKLGDLSRSEQALVKAMRAEVVELTNKTFDEDKVICEQVQLGISETSRTGLLSDEERRIHAFQGAYLKQVGEVAPV